MVAQIREEAVVKELLDKAVEINPGMSRTEVIHILLEIAENRGINHLSIGLVKHALELPLEVTIL